MQRRQPAVVAPAFVFECKTAWACNMVRLTIFHNGRSHPEPLEISPSTTVFKLRALTAEHLSLPSHSLRLLASGKSLTDDSQPLSATPLSSGGKLYVLATTSSTVATVRDARPDPLLRPFGRTLPRYVAEPRATRPSPGSVGSFDKYGFGRVEALPGFADTLRATAILEGLASDAGFLSVMSQKRWKVGVLKEMPPEGKVGVDPVCVLGYNTGKGMAIHLRLRTDDRQGFRPLAKIRQVLSHELAHNEISEHDDQFKELMRWIEKEADKADWRRSKGRAIDAGWNGGVVEGLDPLDEGLQAPLTSLSVVCRLGSVDTGGDGGYRSSISDALAGPKKESEEEVTACDSAKPSELILKSETEMQSSEEPGQPKDVKMHPKEEASREENSKPATSPVTSQGRDPMPMDATQAPAETIRALPTASPPNCNPAVNELTTLGFSPGLATLALRENGRDASRAADWLLSLSAGPSGASAGGDNSSATQRAEAALLRLCGSGLPHEQLVSALDALHLYLSNALRNPGVERFARINAANAAFRRRVGVHLHATALLEAAGFRLRDGVWSYNSMDSAPLWVTKSVVQDRLVEELRR